MRSLSACLLCICLGFSARAEAQAGARDPANEPTAPTNTPASPGASVVSDPLSSMPEVTDAMLEPIDSAPQLLGSWQQATTLMRSRSTSLATARARIEEASGRSRQVLANGLPVIAANGSVNRNLLFATGSTVLGQGLTNDVRLPYPPTVWNAGVSLRQPVFDLRTWYDIRASSTAVEAAGVSAEDTERVALGSLAEAIVSVITAERLAEVSRVSLRSNLSLLDLTQRRTRLGAASALDVLRAEQEVASSRSNVVQADETLRRAREGLGMALGYPDPWGVAADVKVDALARDARALCTPVSDPEQRSDVRAAKLNAEVSEQAAESVQYAHAPTLDVVSDFSYTTDPRSARPVLWSIGALLTIPIYEGGRVAAERDVNVATATVARQQLTDAVRGARLQAVQTQRGVTVAEANFGISRQARDIAAESARLSRVAFVHGTGTSFDLVDTAQRHRLSEIDVTIKEFEVVRARIAALLAQSNCSM